MRPDTLRRARTPDPRGLIFLLLFLVAGFLPPAVHGQALRLAEVHAGDDYIEAVRASRELILEIMEEAGVPGASVAVGIGGQIVWSEGFGWADVELGVLPHPISGGRWKSPPAPITAATRSCHTL